MITTCQLPSTTPTLFLAFDLGWNDWKLAFTIGPAQTPRSRTITARDANGLQREIAHAKRRFGLPDNTPVQSCYEAGRDGFWLHRWLTTLGINNLVVDSSSIEVNRRARRAKSDRLDANKLVAMLIRYRSGETKVWSVCRVPDPLDEDRRHLHRELLELKDERTRQINRIKGLLANQGVAWATIDAAFPHQLDAVRMWDGESVGAGLKAHLLRAFQHWHFIHRQILDLEQERRQGIRYENSPQIEQVRRLLELRGIGLNGAWLLVFELFGWRQFRNRKELGAIVGLTPTPYQSGGSAREQGISKAGNRRLRRMLVELAWCWLRWQSRSELSQWYGRRFAESTRLRKVGIVALARKLLIALWRWLDRGELPAGAELCPWLPKVNGQSQVAAKGVA